MSDDALSERVMLAVLEADEIIFRISNVDDFINWAIKEYTQVSAVFADGTKYKDHELYNARRNAMLAEKKAVETNRFDKLIKGYERLAKTCRLTERTQIEKEIAKTSFKSLLPYYVAAKEALMNDTEKYLQLADKYQQRLVEISSCKNAKKTRKS